MFTSIQSPVFLFSKFSGKLHKEPEIFEDKSFEELTISAACWDCEGMCAGQVESSPLQTNLKLQREAESLACLRQWISSSFKLLELSCSSCST